MAHFHVLNENVVTSLAIADPVNPNKHFHIVGELETSADTDTPGHIHAVSNVVTGPPIKIEIELGDS
jgi:hypothetical protein